MFSYHLSFSSIKMNKENSSTTCHLHNTSKLSSSNFTCAPAVMTPLSSSEKLQLVNPLCNNNCYTKGLLAAYYYLLGDKKTVAEVCIRTSSTPIKLKTKYHRSYRQKFFYAYYNFYVVLEIL